MSPSTTKRSDGARRKPSSRSDATRSPERRRRLRRLWRELGVRASESALGRLPLRVSGGSGGGLTCSTVPRGAGRAGPALDSSSGPSVQDEHGMGVAEAEIVFDRHGPLDQHEIADGGALVAHHGQVRGIAVATPVPDAEAVLAP